MSRLKTIYNANMRVSYSADAWERAQRTKSALPYLMYDATAASGRRTAWTGTVKPVDDPWWNEHMPPCGFNSRCFVRQLTTAKAKALPTFGQKPLSGPSRSFTNSTTGEVVKVPFGIDPGWGYNPGKAALDGDANAQAAKTMADNLASQPPIEVLKELPAVLAHPAAILCDREKGNLVYVTGVVGPAGDRRGDGARVRRMGLAGEERRAGRGFARRRRTACAW